MGESFENFDFGKVCFYENANLSYQHHLAFEHVINPQTALPREQFEALARMVRDFFSERWIKTNHRYEVQNPKWIYYLSMEFLIGRSLVNNVINMMGEPLVRETMKREGIDWQSLGEFELDAGLGNGGLGRLAACFIESMATLGMPAMGYGLRYDYGMFKQSISHGYQVEQADNWLRLDDPWEVKRSRDIIELRTECAIEIESGVLRARPGRHGRLLGIPYDRPVVGYGGETVNTLRLWGAGSPDLFDIRLFNSGDPVGALQRRLAAETLTRVLYPNDSSTYGRGLRFYQEYFLVSCSLADIVDRFLRRNTDWTTLPDKVAIQLNDTHPSIAVAELMRILLDRAKLPWDVAWDVTQRTLAYTNHTLMPEALEKWPVFFFERLLPRHLEIIYEINRRFLSEVETKFPHDMGKIQRVSLIEEGPVRNVRMANLAIIGTHSTNGVAEIHSNLVKSSLVPDFYQLYPDRFNNKTNGVTPRRWLLASNPSLAKLITKTIGDGWITELSELKKILPYADDAGFRSEFRAAKRQAKEKFVTWLKGNHNLVVNPESIFDCQIKRFHEYKRQLLNILHIVILYNRLCDTPSLNVPPRTFFFGGKAAPGYQQAKAIFKLISNVGERINRDPAMKGRLQVLLLPDYNVSLAEKLIPAADVSEQISIAGFEASGTSNMKFMMNGALTVGTRDGANIEIVEEAGEENAFIFGLSAEEVINSRPWYNPRWHYDHEEETRRALDMIRNDYFSSEEPGIFKGIWDLIFGTGDYFMNLADLRSYAHAQWRLGETYKDQELWSRKAIINVACSGKFSSDRTIRQYAEEIWNVVPVKE